MAMLALQCAKSVAPEYVYGSTAVCRYCTSQHFSSFPACLAPRPCPSSAVSKFLRSPHISD
eukprot:6205965-Pleurochrysis_carterae.AAC.3